ncbi:FecR domain-containing protein [Pedobacter sp. PLR]|uniref:FecR domain-containing protein n=1 Tax=Pedobacter sp. PLR TaxID=2994465 RepID=UPI0022472073|nr:FecR domain-containing protein [Pedobacter sp. PLR]MCX2449898.1 FecR domain-containing protein [Pedobacter sp. PLR]
MTDELLIKFLLKETSEEETTAIEKWLAADPANVSAFLELEKIWESSQLLAPKSPVNEELAWLSFKEKLNKKEKVGLLQHKSAVPDQNVVSLQRKYTWINVAAVFILALGAWVFYKVLTPAQYMDLAANQEVITQKLPDGSELTLNKKSALSYASDFKTDRSVRLDSGEVFFNVAPDKSHPFIIEVDQVSVKVVGTSFNVKHKNQQTEVIVETGIVKVSLKGETINLVAGERVLINSSSEKLLKERNQDQLYNYYRTRTFVLKNTPLWKFSEVLNQAYDVKITVDPAIKNLTLSTTLKLNETLDYNLGIICQTLNLTYSSKGKEILLTNKK